MLPDVIPIYRKGQPNNFEPDNPGRGYRNHILRRPFQLVSSHGPHLLFHEAEKSFVRPILDRHHPFLDDCHGGRHKRAVVEHRQHPDAQRPLREHRRLLLYLNRSFQAARRFLQNCLPPFYYVYIALDQANCS